MKLPILSGALAFALTASTFIIAPGAAWAEDLNMWVRASGAGAAEKLVNLWNEGHADKKIVITVIPDNQMVTKLATGTQAGEVPDLISFDLIYMPDFMKAGFLTDLTADLKDDPNYASVAQAYKDIATYDGKIYGAGFTPDVSILIWNKDLFKQAGLDPEKAPTSLPEIHAAATKIRALGDDIYGYYFSGACPGCNIFVTSPMMVAAGAKMLPATADDTPLDGDGVKEVLTEMQAMWKEGLVPESAEADSGANFVTAFQIRQDRHSGFRRIHHFAAQGKVADLNFGVAILPGMKDGQQSAFVGGDVVAIPKGSKQADVAKEFIRWELTDEAQIEGLAKNNIIPSRPALADNKYFKEEPRVVTTGQALGVGYVPWVFHFNDMVNSDSSPWIQMIQTAIFDGDMDGAIATARESMKSIAAQ